MSVHSELVPSSLSTASTLLASPHALLGPHAAFCSLSVVPVAPGVELAHWSARSQDELSLDLRDDSGRIHFTYTLAGHGECRFHRLSGHRCYAVEPDAGTINYCPDTLGRFRQAGPCESVTVMVRPDVFDRWTGDTDPTTLQTAIAAGQCFSGSLRHTGLNATARHLVHALTGDGGMRHRLWLEGQAMSMVGMLLEASSAQDAAVAMGEQRRLMRARDRLLADLGHPPTIAELAEATGMSPLRLKRGFKALFGLGVFGVFQQERMFEARRRLASGASSVTVVAMDLGYTNASHFAAAFRKQFGINPAALRRA